MTANRCRQTAQTTVDNVPGKVVEVSDNLTSGGRGRG